MTRATLDVQPLILDTKLQFSGFEGGCIQGLHYFSTFAHLSKQFEVSCPEVVFVSDTARVPVRLLAETGLQMLVYVALEQLAQAA